MKKLRKVSVALGVCLVMVLAVMPLGAWTTAEAASVEMPETQIEPYGGGTWGRTLNFGNEEVLVTAFAENWWWPGTDRAIITINAGSTSNVYYGFEVQFIWTNTTATTTWTVPGQYNPNASEPTLKLLEEQDGSGYYDNMDMQCNDKSLSGKAGSGWACEMIYVRFSVRVGNSAVQTVSSADIHF